MTLPTALRFGRLACCHGSGLLLLCACLRLSRGRAPVHTCRPSVKMLAVPSFQNQTHTYRVETSLTNAVIREFNTRTHYRVVQSEADADAVLHGTVVSAEVRPSLTTRVTGRASTGLVTIIAKIVRLRRAMAGCCTAIQLRVPRQYQISNELSSFFEDKGRLWIDSRAISPVPWSATSWRRSSVRVFRPGRALRRRVGARRLKPGYVFAGR